MDILQKAKTRVHRPLPHTEAMYGWRLSTLKCFAGTNHTSRDWGGHQCSNKPKYRVGQLQFCTIHAKEISSTLEGFEKITEPLFEKEIIRVNKKYF